MKSAAMLSVSGLLTRMVGGDFWANASSLRMLDTISILRDMPGCVRATRPMLSHVNVGCGEDVSIAELAAMMAKVTRFEGAIRFDTARPDGTPRKLLDVSKLSAMGWNASIPLEKGVTQTYDWYCANEQGAAPTAVCL